MESGNHEGTGWLKAAAMPSGGLAEARQARLNVKHRICERTLLEVPYDSQYHAQIPVGKMVSEEPSDLALARSRLSALGQHLGERRPIPRPVKHVFDLIRPVKKDPEAFLCTKQQ